MVSRGAATQTYSESVAKIGNRDVVGYGWNGEPIYFDRVDYPMPAIRFKENTPDVLVREIRFGNFQCFNLLISINHCRLWERRRRVTGRNCQCKRKRHSTVLHSVRHSPRWNIQLASSRCTSVSLWLPLQSPSTSHWSWLLSVSFTLSQISEIQTNSTNPNSLRQGSNHLRRGPPEGSVEENARLERRTSDGNFKQMGLWEQPMEVNFASHFLFKCMFPPSSVESKNCKI